MNEEALDAYWRGYRDALRDVIRETKASQTFTDDEELKKIVKLIWEDRADREEL